VKLLAGAAGDRLEALYLQHPNTANWNVTIPRIVRTLRDGFIGDPVLDECLHNMREECAEDHTADYWDDWWPWIHSATAAIAVLRELTQ
jgi:hypothetical protein